MSTAICARRDPVAQILPSKMQKQPPLGWPGRRSVVFHRDDERVFSRYANFGWVTRTGGDDPTGISSYGGFQPGSAARRWRQAWSAG
jgi:hypothetical protein